MLRAVKRSSFLLLALATGSAGASFAACSGATSSSDTLPLPCDVDDVLARRCRTCHTDPPQFGAPMPLMRHGDVTAPSRSDSSTPVYKQMGKRIHDDAHPMPQPPNARLSSADMATLDAWIAAGAPAGDTTCSSGAGDAGATNDDGGATSHDASIAPDGGVVIGPDSGNPTCPDIHIAPSAPWSMPQTTDDVYTCYGFDVTSASKRHVIRMQPRIDNSKIVHHMILFEAPSSMSGAPAPCSIQNSVQWRMVYGWAPGAQALDVPPEAGFALEGTTHYVLQVHYNNVNHLAGQTDTTGVDLCSTDQLRPNDADVVAFGSTSFTIQPRSKLDWTCNFTVPQQIPGQMHAFAAIPHMHQIGTSIGTLQLPGGSGAGVDLGTQASWDFQTQTWFPVNATLQAGDVIRTRCVWTNPGDTAVTWGEYTKDEMCFSFTMYYPKIQSSLWSWILPAKTGSCAATP